MKKLLKILLLLLTVNSFGQQKSLEYQDENLQKCDEKLAYFKITKTTFKDGISSEEKFDLKEKQIIHVKNFKKKIKQGKFIYYEDGKISSEVNFENDLLIGDLKIYNKEGKLERTLNYDTARAYIGGGKMSGDVTYIDESEINEKDKSQIISDTFKSLNEYIQKSIYINEFQSESGIKFKDFVDISITVNGVIDDISFFSTQNTKSEINNFQLEILRVLLNDLKFKPATKNGLDANCVVRLPVVFIIDEEE